MSQPSLVAPNSDPDSIDRTAPAAASSRWLLPVVPANSRVSDVEDGYLAAAAHAALAGDRTARDALYAAFAPRLHPIVLRIARRINAGHGPVVETADALQESYLVFVQMIERWNGGPSFTAYVTALFAHRLRDALQRSLPVPVVTNEPIDWLADGSHGAEEARILLEELAGDLPPADAAVLLAHIGDGESLSAIARRTGLSRRTVQRRWTRLVARLRRSYELERR